ncbi:MAG TPA: hypothetical protein VFI48_06545, partial [Hyphomicrobiaceae bacterium]|nr:hypothetical protein [Hyphomicrobiaceae bacterium]
PHLRLWPLRAYRGRAGKCVAPPRMTPRRVIFWLVLLPLTIAVWAQFLPPCVFGSTKIQERLPSAPPPIEPPRVQRYTICTIAGAENCWEVVGVPIR